MKVSAIVAAYNIESYIERCLISIINQTVEDIEIIVVNDGSTDKTRYVVEEVANKDDRIIIINQENKGLIEARKSGVDIARGEYILFIDGDDWLELDTIDSLYKTAEKNNSDIVLYNGFLAYDNQKLKKESFKREVINSNDFLKELFLNKISPSICFKFIKRSFITENNIEFPNDISYAEDLATTSILFMNKPRISTLDKCLYNYYQRENSMVNTITNKILEVNKAISCVEKNLKNKGLYKEYYEEFEYMTYIHLFIYRIILAKEVNDIYAKVHNQYKERKVNIKKNRYIKEEINKNPLSFKVRLYSYHKNYRLGVVYDKVRNSLRKID